MAGPCDLEVDVNGEEIFLVHKQVLASSSVRLRKLFKKPSVIAAASRYLKIIIHDFPGGAEGFELLTRFCYSNGGILITPGNNCLLHSIAHYLEMATDLIERTGNALRSVSEWSWPEVLSSLKQCEGFMPAADSSGALRQILDSLVARIAAGRDTCPTGSSSPESSASRYSCDTRSTASAKNGNHRSWWFDDLIILAPPMIDRVVQSMISQKVDHVTISRFLLHYLKSGSFSSPLDRKTASEVVIDLLYCLDKSTISCKGLFGILRVSTSLNLSKSCISKLEVIVGSQIDQATLDNLLIPSPTRTDGFYDVNLVLRFLKSFLGSREQVAIARLKRVGSLIDSYMTEVAPDSSLKPIKFIALATFLPDAARDCHDAIYGAIDMYLQVHSHQLSEEEKMKICSALNYEKLSSEACKHLARNTRFPSGTAVQALYFQQSKLKNLLKDTNNLKKLARPAGKGSKESRCNDDDQVILYAKKLDLSEENEKLKARLEGMQWKVMELERVCRKMQTQIAKVVKIRSSSTTTTSSRSLPRLCS